MDVFISYANEDRERAHQVAQALEGFGWSVWWDRKIVAGEAFDQTIERELESAKCVVVLWSTASVASEWVKNEAAAAAERGVLVPALISDVKIPLEFRRRQTANLIDWEGDTSSEGLLALREGVAARVGTGPVARAPRGVPSPAPRAPSWLRWPVVAGAIAIVVVIAAYRVLMNSPAADRTSSDVIDSPRSTSAAPTGTPGRADAGLSVAETKVVPSSGSNGIDNPAPLTFGVMHKVTLEQNEEYYFRLPEPANAFNIVQDIRLPKNDRTNLSTQLSILDPEGGVLEANVIRFNEIDVGYRKTASFSTKQPARLGFKLTNTASTAADIWVAVSPAGTRVFFPFFGDVVPQQWSAGKDASGRLETNESVYYVVRLPRGDSRVTVDFANAKRERTNLSGYLAVLDADGGNQDVVLRLNEIAVSYRTVASLSVKGNESIILRLQNTSEPVNYNLRIAEPR